MKKRTIGIIFIVVISAMVLVACGIEDSQLKLPPQSSEVATQASEETQNTQPTEPITTTEPENLGDPAGDIPTQREIYDAFYAYLVANENLILPYQQDLIFSGGGENYARNILVADFNQDGLEDLLCVVKEEFDDSIHLTSKLNILSFASGELVSIIEDEFYVGVGSGTKYAWFTLADGTLVSLSATSDDYTTHAFTRYLVETDGTLRPISCLSVKTDTAGNRAYYLDEIIIDQTRFDQELKAFQDGIQLILKNGPYEYDEIYKFYGAMEPSAMTYQEALEFLKPEALQIKGLDTYLGEWHYGTQPGVEALFSISQNDETITVDLQFYRLIGDRAELTPTGETTASFVFNNIPSYVSFDGDKITVTLEDRPIYGNTTVSQFLGATTFEFERR